LTNDQGELSKPQKSSQKRIKRIVLHVGTRKTGSTTFQNLVRFSTEKFIEGRVFPLIYKGQQFKEFYYSFLRKTSDWSARIQHAITQAGQADCDSVLITSEDLYYLKPDQISELVTYCRSLAEQVDVIVFLRRQDADLESSYSQYVTAGLYVGNIQENFEGFFSAMRPNLDHATQLGHWQNVCGDQMLTVVPYVSGDTVGYLLEFLGLSPTDFVIERANKTKPISLIRSSIYVGEQLAMVFGMKVHAFSNLNKRFDFRGAIRHQLAQGFVEPDKKQKKYKFITDADYLIFASEFQGMNETIIKSYACKMSDGFSEFDVDSRNVAPLSIQHLEGGDLEYLLSTLCQWMAKYGDKRRAN